MLIRSNLSSLLEEPLKIAASTLSWEHTVLRQSHSQTKLTLICLSGKSFLICDIYVYSWAILNHVVQTVYEYNEQTGEYIFMKDPTKAMMRLFKVTAEEEEEEEPEEEL